MLTPNISANHMHIQDHLYNGADNHTLGGRIRKGVTLTEQYISNRTGQGYYCSLQVGCQTAKCMKLHTT